jgi:hypothetical protein
MRYPDTRPPMVRSGFAAAFLKKLLGKKTAGRSAGHVPPHPVPGLSAASTVIAPLSPVPARALPAAPADANAMLNLGQIAARLGYRVSEQFLRSLGIEPAGGDRAAVLYRETDFLRLLDALESHHAQIRNAYLQRVSA